MPDRGPLPEVDAEQFFALDLRVGRITECAEFPQARRPAYRLTIDFGPLGHRRSSARVTELYSPQALLGRMVVAVMNLPPRQVGPVRSEVLVLGVYQDASERVVLLQPERDCEPGDRIG